MKNYTVFLFLCNVGHLMSHMVQRRKHLIVKLSKRTDSQAYTLAAIQAFQLRHGKYTNPDKIQKLVIKK